MAQRFQFLESISTEAQYVWPLTLEILNEVQESKSNESKKMHSFRGVSFVPVVDVELSLFLIG
jgi:hypothetical protein